MFSVTLTLVLNEVSKTKMTIQFLIITICAAFLFCIASAQNRISYQFFQRQPGDVILYDETVSTNLTILPTFHDMWYTWESENDMFTGIVLDLPHDVS